MAPNRSEKVSLWLDFWGARTKLRLDGAVDLAHFTYYFSDYVTDPFSEPDVTVCLLATGDSYLASGPSDREVVIVEHLTGRRQTLRGDDTVRAATPIPPFALAPLAGRIRTVHAAAVTHPNAQRKAVVIHGPSTSGKSTLMLSLLRRGWAFMSDDTLPIDARNHVLKFTRPIGLRERTAKLLGLGPEAFASATRFHTPTGVTRVVHPRDLRCRIGPDQAEWTWTVTLEPTYKPFRSTVKSRRHLHLEFDVTRDHCAAIVAIEEFANESFEQ